MGNAIIPQAAYVASVLQQKISALKVLHLVEANRLLHVVKVLKPELTYLKPIAVRKAIFSSFSDASHPRDRDYDNSGIINEFRIEEYNGDESDIFHVQDWTSHRQKSISYSACRAAILACLSADDRGYYLKGAINSILPNQHTRHEVSVDSNALEDTVTTIHESKEFRLRQTVQRLRNSFESGELDVLR